MSHGLAKTRCVYTASPTDLGTAEGFTDSSRVYLVLQFYN